MAKHTPHQDKIIRRYYQNQDDILIQRLGDLVTDLYLSEGKGRVRLWKRTMEILEKLKVPNTRVQYVCQSDNPTLVAELLKELLEKKG
ncbi:MAG: hypothetical protein WCJ35_27025 [Planctomycetota bacterium]